MLILVLVLIAVNGDRFIATGITFKNTALPQKKQAVAVRNSADRSIFYKCRFISFQDTLYAHSRRQLYLHSTIRGTVDFIFGRAAAVFQFCRIIPRRPLPNQIISITAQGKDCPSIRSGFSVHLSQISPGKDLINLTHSVYTYLGRPWKNYSTTVFMQCYMDGFVRPEGWVEWGEEEAPKSIYYGEFENFGAGAGTEGRVRWEGFRRMRKVDAERFTVGEFIGGDDWILNDSVPYKSGLVDLDANGRG
ncbi:probable pectinesterase/pectinesterase inhibitor 41 [Phalaenopsis equestris]|uniref:probable pectinesterase/pectinesterase inhibitor 41 n=1 Tax=Phalaenopsis equestris TaxID=78828 RepID=UPI0009E2F879|nr:probable pectinesterase/pectinesterase inhibitor 41 [Phalaenopsis equestris]